MSGPWFTRFFLYNLIFLGLQLSYMLFQGSSFLQAIPLPAPVYVEWIITLCIHLGIYFLLSILQMALFWGVMQRHPNLSSIEYWHLLICSLSISVILTANAYFFPLSLFSRLFLPELPMTLISVILFISAFLLSLFVLNTLWVACRKPLPMILILASTILGFLIYPHETTPVNHQHTRPNIILIGVDSLSPENINPENTPTLARFAQESVYFTETISPLARTYPAWTSILTGLYPRHHQARYNLMPPDLVKSSKSIAWFMQKLGYQTIFATDDRRFNSIDEAFGFQKIIGPKLGVNDVLLGTFNDFPLSNLLINLPISRWLFPYNHLNRASHFSYYPQTFDKALQIELTSLPRTSPLFLAVHFALPHWPYAWASSSPAQVKDEYSLQEREQLYLAALKQADKQVAKLLHELQQLGYLENSMVVLLSDHGEALYSTGSRQTSMATYQGHLTSRLADFFKRKTSTELEKSAGHGSDLLSASQYHCALAFKIYRHHQLTITPKIINTRVSLIDIAPTIQAFLGMIHQQHFDGISLLNAINHNHPIPKRAFFVESGMLPNQFLSREKARTLGKQFFTVAPNGRLHLQKRKLTTLDAMKLYAIIDGNWILALYPDDDGYIPITMRLSDKLWTDDLNTEFAQSSTAQTMLNQLSQFYQKNWDMKPLN